MSVNLVKAIKKPVFWAVVASVAVCAVTAAAVRVMTSSVTEKSKSESIGLSCTAISAGLDNIEYEFLYGTINEQYPHIKVRWTNKTKDVLCYGEQYVLYKDNKICPPKSEPGWHLTLNTVEPSAKTEDTYGLLGYNLENGSYRLEKEFYLKSNPDKKYKAFIEFSVDRRYSFLGVQYKGERIVYECGSYSSVIFTDDNIPQFLISDPDFSLLTNDFPKSYSGLSSFFYNAGKLEKITLTKSNFDGLLTAEIWDDGYSAKMLRGNNQNAFFIRDDKNDRLYYLLEQKNGEIYIARGYSSTNSIRWIFKMKELPPLAGPEYDASLNATVLEVYKSGGVLVEPLDEEMKKSLRRINVSTKVVSAVPVPKLHAGAKIRIVFDGIIQETDPAQIQKVFAIYLLDS